MKKSTIVALVAAALVAGLTLGGITTAWAATAPDTAPLGLGLRLGPAIRDANARMIDVLAKLTGKPVTDLQAQRRSGKSIADIAEANKIDPADVVARTLVTRQTILAERVKSGAITQDQADQALARMKTRMTERVGSTATGRNGAGCGAGAGGGRGAGRGQGGSGACGNCTVTP